MKHKAGVLAEWAAEIAAAGENRRGDLAGVVEKRGFLKAVYTHEYNLLLS